MLKAEIVGEMHCVAIGKWDVGVEANESFEMRPVSRSVTTHHRGRRSLRAEGGGIMGDGR